MFPEDEGMAEALERNRIAQLGVIRDLRDHLENTFRIDRAGSLDEHEITMTATVLRGSLKRNYIGVRAMVKAALDETEEALLNSLQSGSGAYKRLRALFERLRNDLLPLYF